MEETPFRKNNVFSVKLYVVLFAFTFTPFPPTTQETTKIS